MRFEFATTNRILFGPGTIEELGPVAASLGKSALLVIGNSPERVAAQIDALAKTGIRVEPFHVPSEPGVELVSLGVSTARAQEHDMVIAIGGGSAIDAGKAIAALVPNLGEVHEYLEVVGEGKALLRPSLPFIAIPTTAGTGSEVTRNAVLTVAEQGVKVSLRGPSLLPRVAIVDPELTHTLPKAVTAASGLDALVQLIEPFMSAAANPMTDALCRDGIRRISRSIRAAYARGTDAQAREDMALGALFSGMALANGRLGAAHGFAGPVGGRFHAPHGAICAALMPAVLEVNLRALRQRESGSSVLGRFKELAVLLTGREAASADDGVAWFRDLCAELQIPPLREYGITAADFPEIIEQSRRSSSMKGNPVVLTEREMVNVLQAAL